MDIEQEKKVEDIITEVLSKKKISPENQEILDAWLQKEENREKFYRMQSLHDAIYANLVIQQADYEKGWIHFTRRIKPQRRFRHLLSYAAGIIMLIGSGITLIVLKQEWPIPPQTNTIAIPGSKQVTLTLSDGREISLSDSLPLVEEENGTIIRNNGSQLVYHQQNHSTLSAHNTIKVPRGGEYILTLSDGSTIWINSESEVTYPVTFSQHERTIKLKGEAFFEIHKDSLRPFLVHTEQFNIRVTGTQFNIRTYPNDVASATLTQGGIQLEQGRHITHLIPGQQASIIDGQVEVKTVDLEETIAWRNEAFCFKQRPLESLLNEIARWYDIEIFYQNSEIRNYHFTAWFRRSTPLNEIIQILEKTQRIKLELKGKTLTVRTN